MRILFPIKGVKDYTCGYRAYSINCLRRAYEKFGEHLIQEDSFACMAELIIKLRSINLSAVEIPIILRYDQKYGKSGAGAGKGMHAPPAEKSKSAVKTPLPRK